MSLSHHEWVTTPTERPIFVVGYMHSGTTLVRNILGNHPSLYCAPEETKFFMHLNLVRDELRRSTAPPDVAMLEYCRSIVTHGVAFRTEDRQKSASAVSQPRVSDRELGQRFRIALDNLTREEGRSRWVEKTPTHVFYADVISAAIPDAMFLEIVRDPRDVLASKKTRTHNVSMPGRFGPEERRRKYLEKSFDPLWDGLSWKSAIRAGEAGSRTSPGGWLRIRYEDLVAETEPAVRRICSFLELDFDDGLLDVPRGVPADVDELGSTERGVASSSSGRWQTVLTPREAGVCERACRREMKQLDYVVGSGSVPLSSVVAAIATRSVPELVERTFHRFRLGGTPYLREILAGYARRLRKLAARS